MPYSDYAYARCAAITKAGKRCTGRWASALSITFSWDPIAGRGLDGPHCVLCHRHRRLANDARLGSGWRFRVVGGWLGRAMNGSVYTVCDTIFATRTGRKPAPMWWRRRSARNFVDAARRDAL